MGASYTQMNVINKINDLEKNYTFYVLLFGYIMSCEKQGMWLNKFLTIEFDMVHT